LIRSASSFFGVFTKGGSPVTQFALPYLKSLHATHAKARDHERHMTELMNLTAMEGMESIWRYEDRLLAQRKNALAVLLRLQGKYLCTFD
jgi:hypothetical protein